MFFLYPSLIFGLQSTHFFYKCIRHNVHRANANELCSQSRVRLILRLLLKWGCLLSKSQVCLKPKDTSSFISPNYFPNSIILTFWDVSLAWMWCINSSSLTLCPNFFFQAGTENSKDGGKKKTKGAAGDAAGRSEVSRWSFCWINIIILNDYGLI